MLLQKRKVLLVVLGEALSDAFAKACIVVDGEFFNRYVVSRYSTLTLTPYRWTWLGLRVHKGKHPAQTTS